MHGVIFLQLKKFAQQQAGAHGWETLLREAKLPEKAYSPVHAYADEEVLALVGAASRILKLPAAAVLEAFGEFLAPELFRLYGQLLQPQWTTFDVIENTEELIHAAVRVGNPDAKPPVLDCIRTAEDELQIVYSSERKLCSLAKGIVKGLSRHFGEAITVTDDACMLKGDPYCALKVARMRAAGASTQVPETLGTDVAQNSRRLPGGEISSPDKIGNVRNPALGSFSMYDLRNFTLADMTACASALRKFGSGATNLQEVAQRIVRYLYDQVLDGTTGEKAFALVRFFKTHSFAGLNPAQRRVALNALGGSTASPDMKCLVLVASVGDKPEWNAPEMSTGHQAIPLPSPDIVRRAPMISQLITQMGLEIATVVKPNPALLLDLAQTNFNVFHVPEAVGSPFIPAQQDFVEPFGVRSVLGFGGMLPCGELFTVILFSKVPISRETADLLQPLALSAKLAILPYMPANFLS